MTDQIVEMTQSWYDEIPCDAIEELTKSGSFNLVYFGQLYELDGGDMDHLKQVVAHDRLTFIEEKIRFFFNTEKECASKRSFDPEKPAIALYLGKNIPPFTLQDQY